MLWSALVQVCMRLELENQVQDVDQQQDNTGATRDFENTSISIDGVLLVERCVESSLRMSALIIRTATTTYR